MIRTIEQAETNPIGAGQAIDYTLYDTFTLDATVPQFAFFETPIGGAKTLAQTNLRQSSQLPKNNSMFVEAMGFRITLNSGAALTDVGTAELMAAFRNAVVTFNIDGRQNQGQWPFAEFMNSMNLVSNAAAGSLDVSFPQLGGGMKKFREVVELGPQVTFDVTISNIDTTVITAASDTLIDIKLILKGTLTRVTA